MIQLELAKPDELMALYQALMAGKFAAGEEELLFSEPLANAANRLVDTLLSEMCNSQNQPMVEMMEQWRQLQPHYPQYAHLMNWLASEEAQVLETSQLKRALVIGAAPLMIDDELMQQLLDSRGGV